MAVNKVILLGRVGKDPDVRYVAQNQPIVSFTLATTDHAYTRQDGTAVPERTEWHNIVMWGKHAEVCGQQVLARFIPTRVGKALRMLKM